LTKDKDPLIDVKIDPAYLKEIADFIDNELNPPSKMRTIIYFYILGVLGGVGLGAFLGWVWVKP